MYWIIRTRHNTKVRNEEPPCRNISVQAVFRSDKTFIDNASGKGGNNIGSRKSKLNFKLIQCREVGTIVEGQKNVIGILESVRFIQKEKQYQFCFGNGYTLRVPKTVLFYHTMLRLEGECVYLEYRKETVFSGMVAYSLFETYGLPLEVTSDEMNRLGIPLDENGFHVLEELQRKRNRNTFQNKNAF